jgi:hypothetical protein
MTQIENKLINNIKYQLNQNNNFWKQIENSNLLSFIIFPYLNVHELNNCIHISKKWQNFSEHPSLWHQLCKNRQMKYAKINQRSTTNWKQLYQQRTIEQNKLIQQKYKSAYISIFFGFCSFDYIWTLFFLFIFLCGLYDFNIQLNRFNIYNETVTGTILSISIKGKQ